MDNFASRCSKILLGESTGAILGRTIGSIVAGPAGTYVGAKIGGGLRTVLGTFLD